MTDIENLLKASRPTKWDAIRVIKRMANVIDEQIDELGYQDEALLASRRSAKVLVRALSDYLEGGA